MPVIYIDVFLALNLFIDFLLLSATARILRVPRKRGRLVLGALVGAASCCLVLVDLPPAPSVVLKLGSAALLIRIAFRWRDPKAYIKQLGVFLVASAVFAGVSFAIWYFAAPKGFYVLDGAVYYNVSPLILVALTVVSYLALSLYDRFTHKTVAAGTDYRLTLQAGGNEVTLRALYDTGHHVTDVFSGSPVALVRYEALEPCLSEELREAVAGAMHRDSFSPAGSGVATAVRTRLRMIPFHSVGGTGLLPAFCPSAARLTGIGGRETDVSGIYVAACGAIGRGEYDAIIGTDIVAMEKGGGLPCRPFKSC